MELLTSLGVDETIAYQVVIFLVTYVAMTHPFQTILCRIQRATRSYRGESRGL